ncbi:hypothetical protein BBK82_07045 [Lentzea guizhouensis]|uniref:Tetratricopeptide repeat protein n=1 Tax=Lentzea guizhouensis TaxID=1586287 RepID=A0A1B2HDX0_9PSEU|nr:tetratricopeptide repeat protein [Lentzea guizhouensis]ANZ35876.1 hypothetical protein BBK82_07045 [Lentzea guizhouensis]
MNRQKGYAERTRGRFTQAGFRSLDQPDLHNLAKVELWQGRTLLEKNERPDAVAHLEQALASMTELARHYDRAQVLDALGDAHVTTDPASADRYYQQAMEIYEEIGHLLTAATIQHKRDSLGR